MTLLAYRAGMHAYLFPASAEIIDGDADFEQGYNDARELARQVRSKPTLTARLTDDGRIDMFVVGPDGIPMARIEQPTWSGEEAEAMARAWMEAMEEQTEEERISDGTSI